jgi:uroporphyrin-III C-methyltransferase
MTPVYLVGAGPGDPDLLTVRAHRVICAAEVLAYDELVDDAILELAPHAERIPVGRRAAGVRYHDERIHPVVIERARAGKRVVRVKGGDPLIFGRGGEEAAALLEARIPFAIVPGISAALGAAASTGIPLTHRDVAASVTFATAHRLDDQGIGDIPADGTIVIYMGLSRLGETAARIVACGRPPSTPVAVIERATTPDERVVVGTLATIAGIARAARIEPPAIAIVGEVVSHRVAAVSQLLRRTS